MGANLCIFRQPSTSTTDDHDHHHDHGHQRDQPKEAKGDIVSKTNTSSSSATAAYCSAIMGLIRRPGCFDQITGHHKKRAQLLTMHQPAEKKSSKVRKVTTLEDWLMDSPATSNRTDCFASGELYAFKHHSSRKVHPSNSSSSAISNYHVPSRSSTALLASKAIRDSITLEPVAKSGRTTNHNKIGGAKEVEVGASDSSLSRSRSGKLVKKVSFKEEPDIIFIHSPEEASY